MRAAGAGDSLATESTGTILVPRQISQIAGHGSPASRGLNDFIQVASNAMTRIQTFCFSVREPDTILSPLTIHFECAQISIFVTSLSLSTLIVDLPAQERRFSFAKQVRFEHSRRSPSPTIFSKREEKHQANDRQKTRQKVSPQFVVDHSSAAVRPDRDRGQRCHVGDRLYTKWLTVRPDARPARETRGRSLHTTAHLISIARIF